MAMVKLLEKEKLSRTTNPDTLNDNTYEKEHGDFSCEWLIEVFKILKYSTMWFSIPRFAGYEEDDTNKGRKADLTFLFLFNVGTMQ